MSEANSNFAIHHKAVSELRERGSATHFVAVDPGKKASGWAYFAAGKLALAGFGLAAPFAEFAICELMEWRPGVAISQPKALIAAQAGGVAVAARAARRDLYLVPVSQWKGSVPKNVTLKRSRHALDREESRVMWGSVEGLRPSMRHNTYDAVAMGLWLLGRITV